MENIPISQDEVDESLLEPEYMKKIWMVRDCNWYDYEYSDCNSIKARLHQYFVFGKFSDCNQWRRDYNNCCRWQKDKDVNSVKEIIDTEENRRTERLTPFLSNSIWEKRTEPPENWNTPLPDWMLEGYKESLLAVKSEEMKQQEASGLPPKRESLCSIM